MFNSFIVTIKNSYHIELCFLSEALACQQFHHCIHVLWLLVLVVNKPEDDELRKVRVEVTVRQSCKPLILVQLNNVTYKEPMTTYTNDTWSCIWEKLQHILSWAVQRKFDPRAIEHSVVRTIWGVPPDIKSAWPASKMSFAHLILPSFPNISFLDRVKFTVINF